MKKSFRFKKLLCLTIVMVLVMQGWPLMTGQSDYSAYATSEASDFTYTIIGDTAEITGYIGTGGTVTIPSTVTIDAKSYSVTRIGDDAFWCSSLTSITIPSSVISIGSDAFGGCGNLTSITIPSGVTSIGDRAFEACESLTSITIPSGVTSIGDGVFLNCWSLTSISIPDGVTSIGEDAFNSCWSLTSIPIPSSVTSIGDSAFCNCIYLTSITIPTGVTKLGKECFAFCDSLTNITIPNSVTSIGYRCFFQCKMTGITIPSSVTSIGISPFAGCNNLVQIDVEQGNTNYSSQDGALYNYDKSTLLQYPPGKTGVAVIPDGVTDFEDYCFSTCQSLDSVIIPNTITRLGVGCFYESENLTSVTIPDSVISIGDYCFYESGMFNSITIPSSVTSIGNRAFSSNRDLMEINVDSENVNYSSMSGVFYNYDKTQLLQYPTLKIGAFTVPSSVTKIGEEAFGGCINLSSVNIPSSVTSIGEYAFKECKSLRNIVIPDSMTSIEQGVFTGCSNIISIIIPSSVTSIGYYAFQGCSLTSVAIPSSVTSIGDMCFESNADLAKVYFMGNAPLLGYDVFTNCANTFTVCYLKGNTDFTNPWYGYPTVACDVAIQFNSNGGSPVPSILAKLNTTIIKPVSPTRTGCTFVGWYKEAACTNAWNFSTDKVSSNTTLYGKWRAPINSAVSNGYNSIKVSWSGAGSATSYKIYRATSATGTYSLVHTSASTTRSWVDTSRTTGRYYYYKVYPVAGGKTYTFSTHKSAKAVPATPSVSLTKPSSTSIKVAWSGVSGASKYQVYRATSASGSYSLVYTASSSSRSWVNTGRTDGKAYYYKVRAYHLEGTTKVYGSFSAVKGLKL